MSDDEILGILKFLNLKMTIEQFNKICKYVQIDYIFFDTDEDFKIHISSKNTNKIKCNIKILDFESR